MAKVSDTETKGGGLHGPPRRWTGGGPRPARHIPWPELFKHHQSVLTGHLKMMDMVRKHCVEGTGNYETAKACVDRTHQMMRMFKEATYNFLPPKDNIDRVPLGASSASMYPGYSPADHIYGEAAQEFGERAAELKRKGMDLKLDPSGPQYVVGQNKRPRQLSQDPDQVQSGSGSSASARDGRGQDEDAEPMEGVEQSTNGQPLFVIDSKPTPITDLGDIQKQRNKANDKAKRRVSFKEDNDVVASGNNSSDEPKTKKEKLDTAESSSSAAQSGLVGQDDDIAAEVEARLAAKEEKRKRKEEKKRKRESIDSSEGIHKDVSATLADKSVPEASAKKLKNKTHNKEHDEVRRAAQPSSSIIDDKEPKKDKKKRKKASADMNEQGAEPPTGAESEKPKKKRKDLTSSS